MSTAASRAWLGVALIGFLVVVLVLALMLMPRFGAGQRLVDAAEPAFTDERVAGTRNATNVLSQYVDVVDPLLTRRGGARREVDTLIGLIRRRLAVTPDQVRKILRREAPHTEALLRALPLNGVAGEVPRLTTYLATILGTTEDEVGATLERDFPRIAQSLAALRRTADAWNDVPGIDGLTRLTADKPVRTVPGLRKYYRDDVVPLIVRHRADVQRLAGSGGIGYIPYLLLVVGLGLLAFGVHGARRSAKVVPGTLSWRLVVSVGVLVIGLVVVAQYFPRLAGAQRTIAAFDPVFAQDRVTGAANGLDTIHEAIEFGDPLMTAAGGASREVPRLYRFIADRTGRTASEVRASVRRRAPQTTALLDAIPLTEVSAEIAPLRRYLSRALRLPGDRLVDTLRDRTPALAQSLLTVPAVTGAWSAATGNVSMTRFDDLSAVRALPSFDDYLRQDLIGVLVDGREDFDAFARKPEIDALAPLLLILGVVVMLYGGVMMQLVARRY
ncbi:MAG: hypothetical protein Q8O56_00140 [Solirubrobacteraceae bacterium]|nr:hypothetical protein [Solirubrobacteraceae bacterium]